VAIARSGGAGAQRIATNLLVAIARSGGAGAQRIATNLLVAIARSGGAGAQRIATNLPGPTSGSSGWDQNTANPMRAPSLGAQNQPFSARGRCDLVRPCPLHQPNG
jgi:hypothetical protein